MDNVELGPLMDGKILFIDSVVGILRMEDLAN